MSEIKKTAYDDFIEKAGASILENEKLLKDLRTSDDIDLIDWNSIIRALSFGSIDAWKYNGIRFISKADIIENLNRRQKAKWENETCIKCK